MNKNVKKFDFARLFLEWCVNDNDSINVNLKVAKDGTTLWELSEYRTVTENGSSKSYKIDESIVVDKNNNTLLVTKDKDKALQEWIYTFVSAPENAKLQIFKTPFVATSLRASCFSEPDFLAFGVTEPRLGYLFVRHKMNQDNTEVFRVFNDGYGSKKTLEGFKTEYVYSAINEFIEFVKKRLMEEC